ncbi:hypothetical protein W04_1525 [Pseudoalteromonas sp. SW0106-04]|nr:hypothetical protein W04_1525 [Pseudoalteromonas sp. SW0106-04]
MIASNDRRCKLISLFKWDRAHQQSLKLEKLCLTLVESG